MTHEIKPGDFYDGDPNFMPAPWLTDPNWKPPPPPPTLPPFEINPNPELDFFPEPTKEPREVKPFGTRPFPHNPGWLDPHVNPDPFNPPTPDYNPWYHNPNNPNPNFSPWNENNFTGLYLPQYAQQAQQGRHGDTKLAHLTEGEVVLPREVAAKLQSQIRNIMNKPDLSELTVGTGKINPATGLEEFWQSGYLSDEADEFGKKSYALHWSDYKKFSHYTEHGTRARTLTGKYKTDEWWADKDIISGVGKLDPKGDFTARERKAYKDLAQRYFYAETLGSGMYALQRDERGRRTNRPTEAGQQVYDTFGMDAGPKRDDESWTAYRNRQAKARQRSRLIKGRTAGSYSHHKANLANALTRWEKNRNKRLERELVARQKAEEEELIRQHEIELGKQRVQEIRLKRSHDMTIAAPEQGAITARGEQLDTDNPKEYTAPKYTTRSRRKRSSKVSNVGFFFNI
jgi:hypothetical protein